MTAPFRIPLMRPYADDQVRANVAKVLASGHWTEGAMTRALENMVRDYVGCRHVMAVTSCTTGLEIALRALGVGPGDEVIVPSFTYPATATAVLTVGAVPVVVDVDPDTALIDLAAAERAVGPRVKAIMPVPSFGNPCDYAGLEALKRRCGVAILEDAAPALAAAYQGKKVGAISDVSVFSLHPRKFITTGEGGLIATNDDDLAARVRSLSHFGMQATAESWGPPFIDVGVNAKLSDILSAVGCGQMASIDMLLTRRLALAERYLALLADIPEIRPQVTTPGGTHSRQSLCVRAPNRDDVMARMRARGVEAQIGTYALHRQPAFQRLADLRGPFPGADALADEALVLPLFHDMTDAEQDEVVAVLRDALAARAP